jgi:hypothetical protein
MPPMRVVPAFDPFEHRQSGLGLGLEDSAIQHFSFQCRGFRSLPIQLIVKSIASVPPQVQLQGCFRGKAESFAYALLVLTP